MPNNISQTHKQMHSSKTTENTANTESLTNISNATDHEPTNSTPNQTANEISQYSLRQFCNENRVKAFAIRPFVRIRSITNSPTVRYFGDLINGPHSYSSKKINHRLCADAYFKANLGMVSSIKYCFALAV